jgi:hypothetical protein
MAISTTSHGQQETIATNEPEVRLEKQMAQQIQQAEEIRMYQNPRE